MKKAEAKYRYLVNEEKYDPQVRAAVSNKSISHSDAIKIHAMQQMMQKERELKAKAETKNHADYVSNELSKKYTNK